MVIFISFSETTFSSLTPCFEVAVQPCVSEIQRVTYFPVLNGHHGNSFGKLSASNAAQRLIISTRWKNTFAVIYELQQYLKVNSSSYINDINITFDLFGSWVVVKWLSNAITMSSEFPFLSFTNVQHELRRIINQSFFHGISLSLALRIRRQLYSQFELIQYYCVYLFFKCFDDNTFGNPK